MPIQGTHMRHPGARAVGGGATATCVVGEDIGLLWRPARRADRVHRSRAVARARQRPGLDWERASYHGATASPQERPPRIERDSKSGPDGRHAPAARPQPAVLGIYHVECGFRTSRVRAGTGARCAHPMEDQRSTRRSNVSTRRTTARRHRAGGWSDRSNGRRFRHRRARVRSRRRRVFSGQRRPYRESCTCDAGPERTRQGVRKGSRRVSSRVKMAQLAVNQRRSRSMSSAAHREDR